METSLKLEFITTKCAILAYEDTCTQRFFSKEVGFFLLKELAKIFRIDEIDFNKITKKIESSLLQNNLTEEDTREGRENIGKNSTAAVIRDAQCLAREIDEHTVFH